jgi:hypothetical protein
MYGQVEVQINVFQLGHWVEVSGQLHSLSRSIPVETAHGACWIGDWLCPTAVREDIEKIKSLAGNRTPIPPSSSS